MSVASWIKTYSRQRRQPRQSRRLLYKPTAAYLPRITRYITHLNRLSIGTRLRSKMVLMKKRPNYWFLVLTKLAWSA